MPLAIIWFGIGNGAVIFVIANTIFFCVDLQHRHRRAEHPQLAASRGAQPRRARRARCCTQLILPGALVQIILGFRTSMAYGWRALVAGEMIAGTNGLGYMTIEAVKWYKTDTIIMGMIVIGLLWLLLDRLLFVPLERATIVRWARHSTVGAWPMTRRDPTRTGRSPTGRRPSDQPPRPPFADFAGPHRPHPGGVDAGLAERPSAPAGAPNVVIVYMDDMGFSDPGCFGGEIDTPHIDALAARGLRFTHYTTHPLCSPARAALHTGMNAHAVGTGWLANTNPGYPGYSGEIPLDAATLPETLRAAGYETIMVGKWHNTPTRDCVPSAPKHTWPTRRGFDTFYGFMEGEAHFFFPAQLMMGTQLVPVDEYPRDYYTTDDWTDRSIQYLKELRASSPTKPFLLYLAHNAVHAPLQAKPADLARYRGRYDAGWTAIRQARLEKQIELGVAPPDTRLPASDPRVPRGTRPIRPTVRSWRGTWKSMPRCSTASTRTSGDWWHSWRRSASWTTRFSCSPRTTAGPTRAGRPGCSTTTAGTWGWRRRRSKRSAPSPPTWEAPGAPPSTRPAGARCRTRRSPRSRRTPGRAGGACRSSCPGRPASARPARSAGSSCT